MDSTIFCESHRGEILRTICREENGASFDEMVYALTYTKFINEDRFAYYIIAQLPIHRAIQLLNYFDVCSTHTDFDFDGEKFTNVKFANNLALYLLDPHTCCSIDRFKIWLEANHMYYEL